PDTHRKEPDGHQETTGTRKRRARRPAAAVDAEAREAEASLGLTLIRKSRGTRPKRDPHIALVLAGGAVSGGAFKVGGLKALDDFLVGRKITDFDTYV